MLSYSRKDLLLLMIVVCIFHLDSSLFIPFLPGLKISPKAFPHNYTQKPRSPFIRYS